MSRLARSCGCSSVIEAVESSVEEVWFGLVSAIFCQTGNQTIRFLTEFLKPKPKLLQTICISLVWFKLGFKPFDKQKLLKTSCMCHVVLVAVYGNFFFKKKATGSNSSFPNLG